MATKKKTGTRTRWSRAQDEALRRWAGQHFSDERIARNLRHHKIRLDATAKSVAARRRKLGLLHFATKHAHAYAQVIGLPTKDEQSARRVTQAQKRIEERAEALQPDAPAIDVPRDPSVVRVVLAGQVINMSQIVDARTALQIAGLLWKEEVSVMETKLAVECRTCCSVQYHEWPGAAPVVKCSKCDSAKIYKAVVPFTRVVLPDGSSVLERR